MFGITNLQLFTPEIIVLAMANVVLMATVFLDKRWSNCSYYLSQAALIAATIALIKIPVEPVKLFHNMVQIDALGQFLKAGISLIALWVLIYARRYISDRDIARGEFYVLTLFSILGMYILVGAANLLSMYLGLELVSLPIYTMVAMQRNSSGAAEAGMKYFVMGALATGMMLYGISIIYGLTTSLDFTQVANNLAAMPQASMIVALFGLSFILIGVAFKFGAAPFHMWVPDVYEGAPTAVTTLIASAPKLAAMGMFLRLFNDAFIDFTGTVEVLFLALALLSLAIGNIAAIAQTNIKRMLAYSTIAHIGFMFLALMAGTDGNYMPAIFYICIYALMALAAFGVLGLLSDKDFEINEISDLAGLSENRPWFAFLLLIIMFSMAGVPPTAGFYAKFLVINSLVESGHVPLAITAVVFSIIGAYYYLRVIKTIYFDTARHSEFKLIPYGASTAVTVNSFAILVLGIMPGPLVAYITNLI